MTNAELLKGWMEENSLSQTQVAKVLHTNTAKIHGMLDAVVKETVRKYNPYWIMLKELTGLPFDVDESMANKQKVKTTIPEYIENMLKSNGKTVVSKELYDCLGEHVLIEYFHNKGIKCVIEITHDETNKPYHYLKVVKGA